MTPFVGRAKELEALRGLMSRARRENAPVAGLITGEPGTGKSRLLREAITGADARRLVVLTGFEPTEPIPLAAAAGLLRYLASVPAHGARLREVAFGTSALSAREREVADLVAAGATNAEVAERLAIAPRTVERHLTNILAKVGARNRTELAATLMRA